MLELKECLMEAATELWEWNCKPVREHISSNKLVTIQYGV
jgi:hypothetical protein